MLIFQSFSLSSLHSLTDENTLPQSPLLLWKVWIVSIINNTSAETEEPHVLTTINQHLTLLVESDGT